ncbi:unnamed protein product [Hydatigera taeniaeformis]|uniref:Aa_trans domain-containing protein n=1 Tax=Hydatigena taeniaeformis TaxID=6205 RepID=A0A0R3WRV1_HYDTA|nr:unnamed protein product [Hydatigera taeniaeformis]
MLTSLSNYAVVPVSLSFLGRLGKTKLAAGGLAISIFHVAGVSVIVGLLTASETLFSQVYHANKLSIGSGSLEGKVERVGVASKMAL